MRLTLVALAVEAVCGPLAVRFLPRVHMGLGAYWGGGGPWGAHARR